MVYRKQEITKLFPVKSASPKNSVLCPIIYLFFTADFLTSHITTASFVDDKAIIVNNTDPNIASIHPQHSSKIYKKGPDYGK